MKNLLFLISLLVGSISFSQSWEFLGIEDMFGLTNERQMEVLDNGKVYVFYTNPSDGIELYRWDGQWTQIIHPFAEVSSDLTITSHANTLYLGFKSTSENYEVHSYDGNNFVQLGDLSSLDYLQGSTDLAYEHNSGGLILSTEVLDLNPGAITNSQVHHFNGTTWSPYGSQMFLESPDPELIDSKILSNGSFSWYLSLENDAGGAMPVFGNDGEIVGYQNNNKALGDQDNRLYFIDNLAPSTWSAYDPGFYFDELVEKIDLAGNVNKDPIIGYTFNGSPMSVKVTRAIGGGTFENEPTYTGLQPINDFDMAVGNNDSAYFVVAEFPQGPITSHLMFEDAGNWAELGTGIMIGTLSDIELSLSDATNKPYVLYQLDNGQTGVRVYNNPPASGSISGLLPICQDVSDQLLKDDIYVTDADNDSLWLFGESDNQALITDANISFTRTSAFDPMSPDNHFSMSVTPENGMSGSFYISIFATDGIDTTMIGGVGQTVEVPTTASIVGMPTEYCNNGVIDLLDQYGSPAGGEFYGEGIYNNILNPQLLVPDGYGANYIYQDNNGCIDTALHIFGIWDVPDLSLTITNAGCSVFDGEIDATITGGTAPYSTYWSNGSTSEDISGLSPNMYYMNVTDFNDCYVMTAANVSTTGFDVTGAITHLSCHGDQNGAIDITTAGTGPFSFQWSNGASTEDLTGLEEGQYEVFVTDGTGCESMASFTVTAPDPINATFSKVKSTCGAFDGNLTVNETGGAGSNDYQWFDYLMSPIGTNSALIGAIGSGQYFVEITDANGCEKTFSSSLGEVGGPVIVVSSVTDAGCSDDGAINVTILSNAGIQSTDWSNGENTADISGLSPDQYTLTATDNQGCISMTDVVVDPIVPATDEICVVTVDSLTNTNLIIWEKPVATDISHFNIYRESSVAGVFQLVDSVLYSEESEYNDTIAYPHLRSWRYKLTTVNNCGIESYNGLIHKTIHLVINAGLPGSYNLTWDKYEGFTYPTYFVWRHNTGTGWEEIDQLAFGNESITDSPASEDGLDYRIAIEPPFTCQSTFKATDYNSSRSNKADGVTLSDPDDGVGITSSDIGFRLYPNPADNELYIITKGLGGFDLTVFDLSGKIVISKNISTDVHLLDVQSLSAGSYLIQIRTANGIANEQLIVR